MDEIPEGLDDLLNSILGKKKSNPSGGSSALAISSKAKNKQSVKEDNIEEVILRLLGLDDVSDIDYDTYKTLLREKMAAGRMSNSQMPTEEVELLTDEFKRVKSKTGRFKPKPKKKVKADAFFSGAIQRKSAAPKKQGPAPKTKLQDEVINEIQKIKPDDSSAFIENTLVPQVNKISENLNSIVDTLNKQFQLEKKSEKKEVSAADTLKKKTRETKLETPEKDNKFKSAAKAALKPAGNFFDMILDFFTNILLGGALLRLIEILKDPGKAFQPFVDFVNKFIDFINSISTWTNENILGPINDFIGGIFDAFNALEDNINKALELFGQKPIDNIKEEDKPVLEIPMIPQYENPFAAQEPVAGLSGGSMVTGSTGQKISGMGADTQLVALSPGEVVMSNKAGDMYGRDNLLAANAAAGGTNRPKMGKVQMASGGGQIMAMQNGGIVEHLHGEPGRTGYRADHGTVKNAHDHFAFSSKNLRISVQKALAAGEGPSGRKYTIGSTTRGEHVDTSHHYAGTAFDIPWSQFGSGAIGSRDFQQSRQLQKDVDALVVRFGGTSSGTKRSDDTRDMRGPANVANTKPNFTQIIIPASASDTQVNVVLVPAGQGKNGQSLSNSGANQSKVPGFSAIDANNFEMMVVKSIYNIVG